MPVRILSSDISTPESSVVADSNVDHFPAQPKSGPRIRLTSTVRDRNAIQRQLALADDKMGYSPKNREASKTECWKDDAWDSYEHVEAVAQAVDTVAKGVAKGKLTVGVETDTGAIIPSDAELPNQVLREFKGPKGRNYKGLLLTTAQILQVSGDGYFLAHKTAPIHENDRLGSDNDGRPLYREWEFVSDQEVSVVLNETEQTLSVYRDDSGQRQNFGSYGTSGLRNGSDLKTTSRKQLNRDNWYVARGYRRNPRFSQLSDSALKKNLDILHEIRKLDNQIHSIIDSKMPSGILLVPTEITLDASDIIANPQEVADGAPPEYFDQFDVDFFDHYATPIIDHADPVNRLPFLIRGAAAFLKEVRYLDVSKNLDMVPHRIRNELLQRLYIGLDIPKEIIEGKGSLNHWTGSNVDSNLTSNHVIPLGILIAELITEHYFRPVLIQRGMSPEEAERYHILFDPSEILPRADKSTIAIKLYELEVISERALLEASGFAVTDAPNENERRQRLIFKLILSSPVTLAPLLMPKLDGLEEVAEELERLRALEEEGGVAAGGVGAPDVTGGNKRASEPSGDDQRGKTRSSAGRSSSLIPKTQDDNQPTERTADLPPSEQRRQDSDQTIGQNSTLIEEQLSHWIENNLEELGHLSPLIKGKSNQEIVNLIIGSGVVGNSDESKASGQTVFPMQVDAEEVETVETPKMPAELLTSLTEGLALVRVQVLAIANTRLVRAVKLKRAELNDPKLLTRLNVDSPDGIISEVDEDDLALLGLDWNELLDSSPRDNLAEVTLDLVGGWLTYNLGDDDSGDNAPVLAAAICQASTDYIRSTTDLAELSTEEAMAAGQSIIEVCVAEFFAAKNNTK